MKLDKAGWVMALLALNLVLVWALPLIPAQDLPQHLSYIRIFADYNDPSLPFHAFYTLPPRFQPYDSIYLILAAIARHSSVIFALRVALSVYVILTFVSFDCLAAAAHGRTEPRRPLQSTVLATMLIWSSVLAMGFLQYFLCVPFVVLAVAALVAGSEADAPEWVTWLCVPASMAVASIHLVAAGALGLFVVIYVAVTARQEGVMRRADIAGRVIGGVVLALVIWHFVGGEVLGARPRHFSLDSAWRNAQGFEFVNNILDTTWYDPPVTFNYICWGVLGPYRIAGLGIAFASIIMAAGVVAPVAQPGDLRPTARQYGRAAVAFAVFVCLLVPWGIQVPSEITYLNYRLISLAFTLLLPLVPPRWFDVPRAKFALVGLALVYFANFAVCAIGFNLEAAPAIKLLAKVPNTDTVLSVVFRGRSNWFAKGSRETHFLPMYFTVLDGGICSQFWAKYTEHLPIDYKPGKRPAQPDDWSPQNFDEKKHLKDVSWVIFQRATSDDPDGTQRDAIRAEEKLRRGADQDECIDDWCLYKVRKPEGAS